MILYLSFEELSALSSSAEDVLAAGTGHGITAAPPQFTAEVERFAGLLEGDLSIENLDEQRRTQRVVAHLLAVCRTRLDNAILEMHAADEDAIAAYFAYAHVLTVHRRIDEMGNEMTALLQLMGEQDPEDEATRRFTFPD